MKCLSLAGADQNECTKIIRNTNDEDDDNDDDNDDDDDDEEEEEEEDECSRESSLILSFIKWDIQVWLDQFFEVQFSHNVCYIHGSYPHLGAASALFIMPWLWESSDCK